MLRRRMKSCSEVAWNPVNSTQLVAACDHHLSPTLHRWDLRSPNTPFELLGHDQVALSQPYAPTSLSPLRLEIHRETNAGRPWLSTLCRCVMAG